jgi:hypothetical protein
MNSAKIELTDPAKELAALGQLFLGSPSANTAIAGLSSCIGISLDNPEFLDVLAAVQRRVREVEVLAATVDDDDFDQELKNEVLSATKSFTQLLHPQNAHAQWDPIRSAHLPAKNITALRFFSQTARRHRPLRVVSEDERNKALDKVRGVMKEIRSDNQLDDWMKIVLISGLERVHLILRHLRFFGHELAIMDLFVAHQKVSVVAQTAETQNSKSTSVWQALAVLSIVGNLFILPDQALTAFDRYRGWARIWSNQVLEIIATPQIPPDQRLLPSPAAITEKTPREDAEQ